MATTAILGGSHGLHLLIDILPSIGAVEGSHFDALNVLRRHHTRVHCNSAIVRLLHAFVVSQTTTSIVVKERNDFIVLDVCRLGVWRAQNASRLTGTIRPECAISSTDRAGALSESLRLLRNLHLYGSAMTRCS